jgi:hypothetical protein
MCARMSPANTQRIRKTTNQDSCGEKWARGKVGVAGGRSPHQHHLSPKAHANNACCQHARSHRRPRALAGLTRYYLPNCFALTAWGFTMTHVQLSNVAVLGMLGSTIRDCNSFACTPLVLQYIEPTEPRRRQVSIQSVQQFSGLVDPT